ncbi:hypothetical protein [Streptomyces malaysiensis]|uniref:hypothetical protein n=1 Tax=Streptomyces malaysiensis TaxID=92644 RepID=UPI001F3CC0F3|nr:hypothetical protein [Streptomyces autolyticus]
MRTAVADLLPKHVTDDEPAPAPKLPITLDMPGKAADLLRTTELDDVERAALDHGQAVRRGTGHTVRVTAVPAVHRQLLDLAQVVDGPLPVPRGERGRYRLIKAGLAVRLHQRHGPGLGDHRRPPPSTRTRGYDPIRFFTWEVLPPSQPTGPSASPVVAGQKQLPTFLIKIRSVRLARA